MNEMNIGVSGTFLPVLCDAINRLCLFRLQCTYQLFAEHRGFMEGKYSSKQLL